MHILPHKLNLPLLEAYLVGAIMVLAGLSFLIPNRMPVWSKHLLAFCFGALGTFYIWIAVGDISEVGKATYIRIILGFTGASIFIMNVAFAVSNHYRQKTNKLLGYQRRSDDISR